MRLRTRSGEGNGMRKVPCRQPGRKCGATQPSTSASRLARIESPESGSNTVAPVPLRRAFCYVTVFLNRNIFRAFFIPAGFG